MTDSTKNAATPESSKSRNSNSSVQIQMGARRRGTAPKLPRAIRVGPNEGERKLGEVIWEFI